MQTTELKQKTQRVKDILAHQFGEDLKFREVGNIIRFNIDSLQGKQLAPLAHLFMVERVDIEIKRSGTGLVVILTLYAL